MNTSLVAVSEIVAILTIILHQDMTVTKPKALSGLVPEIIHAWDLRGTRKVINIAPLDFLIGNSGALYALARRFIYDGMDEWSRTKWSGAIFRVKLHRGFLKVYKAIYYNHIICK